MAGDTGTLENADIVRSMNELEFVKILISFVTQLVYLPKIDFSENMFGYCRAG